MFNSGVLDPMTHNIRLINILECVTQKPNEQETKIKSPQLLSRLLAIGAYVRLNLQQTYKSSFFLRIYVVVRGPA